MTGGREDLIARWIEGARAIVERFPPGPEILPEDPHEQAAIFNAELARGLAFCELSEALGIGPTVAEFKAKIIEELVPALRRKLTWGEELCIAAATFYREGIGIDGTIGKAPMEDAMITAEIVLRAAKAWQNAGEEGDLADYIRVEYDRDPPSTRDVHTPRKSIQRFRGRIQGRTLFHFDKEAFQIEVVSHNEIVHGTSRRPGRPRKKS